MISNFTNEETEAPKGKALTLSVWVAHSAYLIS